MGFSAATLTCCPPPCSTEPALNQPCQLRIGCPGPVLEDHISFPDHLGIGTLKLRDQGWGQIRIARELGVGVGRVNRWVQEEYLPPEIAWCLGLCTLATGTLDEMEQLQTALEARGYQSKIDFRNKP